MKTQPLRIENRPDLIEKLEALPISQQTPYLEKALNLKTGAVSFLEFDRRYITARITDTPATNPKGPAQKITLFGKYVYQLDGGPFGSKEKAKQATDPAIKTTVRKFGDQFYTYKAL